MENIPVLLHIFFMPHSTLCCEISLRTRVTPYFLIPGSCIALSIPLHRWRQPMITPPTQSIWLSSQPGVPKLFPKMVQFVFN